MELECSPLLKSEVQLFILQHEDDDENRLLLKHKTILGMPTFQVVDQISGRRKAKLKLPHWYKTKSIIYPPSISLEQCSSEATAKFKIEVLKRFAKNELNRAVDLTGGFGVDCYFLNSIFENVDYVEPNEKIFEIAKHNYNVRESKIKNSKSEIKFHNTTAEEFLAKTTDTFDIAYLDPSRRSKGNQKIFRLADCAPNVIELLDLVFAKAEMLLLKASPMLDLHQGIVELKYIAKIFVVSVDNECKEVLFMCHKGYESAPAIEAVDLKSSSRSVSFSFKVEEEKQSKAEFSNPLRFLYEPNVAILKAGAFKLIAERFGIKKLQQHTHLYTSQNIVSNFPGKIFEIESLIKPDSKIIGQYFKERKANVVTRNYPLSPDQLKRKTKLKDGGEKFLIGFSGVKEKFVAVCTRLEN